MSETVMEDWHTLAGRLRWAIKRQPSSGRQRGLRLFQRRMEEHAPDVQGTSLSAIQGYLRGGVEPSLSFVRQASVLLAVREYWLAYGAGAPTEEEEAGRRESPETELFHVSTAVYGALGIPTQVEGETLRVHDSAVWAPIVRQTVLRLNQFRPTWAVLAGQPEEEGSVYSDATWDRAVQDTATAIAAPLRALGIDPAHLDTREITEYVSAAALTLHQIIYRYAPGRWSPRYARQYSGKDEEN